MVDMVTCLGFYLCSIAQLATNIIWQLISFSVHLIFHPPSIPIGWNYFWRLTRTFTFFPSNKLLGRSEYVVRFKIQTFQLDSVKGQQSNHTFVWSFNIKCTYIVFKGFNLCPYLHLRMYFSNFLTLSVWTWKNMRILFQKRFLHTELYSYLNYSWSRWP